MTDKQRESLSPYLTTLQANRLGLRCTCPPGGYSDWCDRHGDSRFNNLDYLRLLRTPKHWQDKESILGSVFIGVCGALGALLLLGVLEMPV